MSRLYLRLALIPLVLFGISLLLIHIQPNDDNELRQVLLPDGCAVPCFMGIRPGETSMEAAMAILEANPWISDIRTRSGIIEWTWSGLTPDGIDRRFPSYMQHSNIPGEECCVGSFKFKSLFTLGELYLLLGEPPRTNFVHGANFTYGLVSISYIEQNIRLFTTVPCPLNRYQFWQAQAETYIESNLLYDRESGVSAAIDC